MGNSYLEQLVGLRIDKVTTGISTIHALSGSTKVEQPARSIVLAEIVLLIEEYSLNITNPTKIEGAKQIEDLAGLFIAQVSVRDDKFLLVTDQGAKLHVDLRPESYRGPEAMCLNGPNNLCVVWN